MLCVMMSRGLLWIALHTYRPLRCPTCVARLLSRRYSDLWIWSACKAGGRQSMARILVVEDDPDICRLVTLLLQSAGHSVLTASDGAQGVTLAREGVPDLIVMDLVLPITDGWTAIRRLKGEARTAHIPILALSAHAQTDDRMRARAAGCDDF